MFAQDKLTPLMLAALKDRGEVARALLQASACAAGDPAALHGRGPSLRRSEAPWKVPRLPPLASGFC